MWGYMRRLWCALELFADAPSKNICQAVSGKVNTDKLGVEKSAAPRVLDY